MATPQLDDDGRIVTLDLHGATVDEALDMTYRTLRLAEQRGRTRLKSFTARPRPTVVRAERLRVPSTTVSTAANWAHTPPMSSDPRTRSFWPWT